MEEEIRARCRKDAIMRVLMIRLADIETSPTSTKESVIACYAQSINIPVSHKSVRDVVLFLTDVGAVDFFQDPERRVSKIIWKTDAVFLAKRVLGMKWTPSNSEINKFMESL